MKKRGSEPADEQDKTETECEHGSRYHFDLVPGQCRGRLSARRQGKPAQCDVYHQWQASPGGLSHGQWHRTFSSVVPVSHCGPAPDPGMAAETAGNDWGRRADHSWRAFSASDPCRKTH